MVTATAAILREPQGEMCLEAVELDELRNGEILVKVEASGICHTDAKFRAVVPLPAVFGHEGTGIVEETGEGVTGIKPGDRVIMSYAFCGSCPCCQDDKPYLCEKGQELSFSGKREDGSPTMRLGGEAISAAFFQQSSFASHSITLAKTVVPLATDLPPEMLAAIPCGVQTGAGTITNTFQVRQGESVIVFGAGTVGLSAVMAAKMIGAGTIVCIDRIESRLDKAMELGATHVLNIDDGEIPSRVRTILPRGVQYALDSSATVRALDDAIRSIGQGGKVAIVSYPEGGRKFPFSTKELFTRVGSLVATIQGHSVPRQFLPKLIEWQRAGLFPYEKLITTYEFGDINRAFSDAASGAVIKPVLVM